MLYRIYSLKVRVSHISASVSLSRFTRLDIQWLSLCMIRSQMDRATGPVPYATDAVGTTNPKVVCIEFEHISKLSRSMESFLTTRIGVLESFYIDQESICTELPYCGPACITAFRNPSNNSNQMSNNLCDAYAHKTFLTDRGHTSAQQNNCSADALIFD